MNPKLQAINAAGLMDSDEVSLISSPLQANDDMSLIQPMGNSMGDEMDKAARERETADIERQIERIPDPDVKAPLHDKLRREKSTSMPDNVPSTQALGAITQEVHQEQSKADAKEGEEIYQKMMGAIAGGIGFIAAGATLLPLLVEKLSPSHDKIEQELALLQGHGVPGSGRFASNYDLGVMPVPAGLPAISREMQLQRNESFVRNIADEKQLA
jgi:hypothetical protein